MGKEENDGSKSLKVEVVNKFFFFLNVDIDFYRSIMIKSGREYFDDQLNLFMSD